MTNHAIQLAKVRALASSGEALRIREAAGLTRGDVARSLGVSISAVRRWEMGERNPTGVAALNYGRLLERLTAVSLA